MAESKLRVRFPAGGVSADAVTLVSDSNPGKNNPNVIPLKEWSITDDVLTVADSAAFTIDNIDGRNSGKITSGQRVEVEASEAGVAGGQWTRIFTGRVKTVTNRSEDSGDSILISCMDLGWHLTSCCARPLQSTNGITLITLVQRLVHPSWGFKTVEGQFAPGADVQITSGNDLNRRLKQGRTGVLRAQPRNPEQILPPIQVEPGQKAWEIMEEYFQREGFLLNVGSEGDIIVFQPDYFQPTQYETLSYRWEDGARNRNNVTSVNVNDDMDGTFSRVQCWSTVVVPTEAQAAAIAQHPNAQFLWSEYAPSQNPLPFDRLEVKMDTEAINETMRKMRAQWTYQMGAFNSLTYECTVAGHSSTPNGGSVGIFWASDSMVSVDDSVNNIHETMYIQRVQKSMSEEHGARTQLTLRRAGLLDPSLTAQVSAAGRKKPKP